MQVLGPEQMLATPPSPKLTIAVEELHNLLTAELTPPATPPATPPKEECAPEPVRPASEVVRAPPLDGPCAPVPGISQLSATLYLSGAGVAVPAVLDRLRVRFVISVAPELPDTPLSDVTRPLYLRVNVLDRPDVDLSAHFDTVADMIEEVRQHGGATLVHCVAGVSRSASLCLAYLMKHAHMSLRDAYHHVKAARPQIRPNSGFFQQLMRYERQLRGTASVRMVFYESLNREIPDVYEPEYRPMEEFYQRHRNALKLNR